MLLPEIGYHRSPVFRFQGCLGPSGVEKILGIGELNEHETTRLAEVKKQLKDEIETGECNELNVPYNTFTYSDVVRKLLIVEPKVKAPPRPRFALCIGHQVRRRPYSEDEGRA